MRIFSLSDIHVDYPENLQWIRALSASDYRDDVLILAGDVSDRLQLIEEVFQRLTACFQAVIFVPGNHDLWVKRCGTPTSLDKFDLIQSRAHAYGVKTSVYHRGRVSIVPLLGWYDYSFGMPGKELQEVWMDFHACVWPRSLSAPEITRHFLGMNCVQPASLREQVISFSHFLPRVDVMPTCIPAAQRYLYPVLGTSLLDAEIRSLRSQIHVYGHSHVNRQVEIDGVLYVNNAFGYPAEAYMTQRRLLCVYDSTAESSSGGSKGRLPPGR